MKTKLILLIMVTMLCLGCSSETKVTAEPSKHLELLYSEATQSGTLYCYKEYLGTTVHIVYVHQQKTL